MLSDELKNIVDKISEQGRYVVFRWSYRGTDYPV